MFEWIFGILLILVGLALLTNALGLVDRAARLWPRAWTRGDVQLFVSSSFLLRFIALLLTAAGIALVLLAIVD
jgi:hypothetical protein